MVPSVEEYHALIKEISQDKCISEFGRQYVLYFNTVHDEIIQSILRGGSPRSVNRYSWSDWHTVILLDNVGTSSMWSNRCTRAEEDDVNDKFAEARKLHNQLVDVANEKIKFSEKIGKKATDQAIRDIYEKNTSQSATPGTGPADIIRKFVGVQPKKGTGRKTRRRRYKK